MYSRIVFVVLTLFWVTMNVLLWRAEFGGKNEGGTVPVSIVWQKILMAPDDSNLDITQQGKKIGSCRWSPNVGEELATGKVGQTDFSPDGRIKKASGYSIDIMEGMVDFGGREKRFLFNFNSHFSTNHQWQDFSVRVSQRPAIWDLQASAAEQTLTLRMGDGGSDWQRKFTFAELRDPQKLLQEFAGGLPLGMLAGGMVTGLGTPQDKSVSLALDWDARHDWLEIGHSRLKVYRLHTKLAGKYEVTVYTSRVGEILRVELPNGIRLQNSRLDL
jgi:hypothetical protein